jgi:hypothetical protein
MPVMFKIISEYFRYLWSSLLYVLGWIIKGTKITKGPREELDDCT